MKNITTIIAGLFCTISAYCQDGEFKVYPNGLIYSEQTMNKLSHIVDSLNLKFKTCNFNTVYYSKSQTIGHIIKVEKDDIKQAKTDMENQISLDEFLKKYPKATIKRNVLIIKSKYNNEIEFEEFDVKSDYGFSITSEDVSLYKKDFSNQWLLEYSEKTKYSDESLSAFYFPSNFSSVSIPQKYSQMIGYSDCLIDTTTTKFKDNIEEGWIDLPENWTSLSENKKATLLDEMRSTRAHLDIMNDRFERMSDANYAWGHRNTYIKELEELNINVSDLMMGISFRIENPASNHYFSSIRRVGRALSETKNRIEIEQVMLSIVSDNELDIYNRLLFYFLFRNYNYYIKDEAVKKENDTKLETAIKTLPDFISERLINK